MAVGKQWDYKSEKIALTVSKSALTKAEKEFETYCKDIQKNSDAIHIKKVRIAASVMEALDGISQKLKRIEDAKCSSAYAWMTRFCLSLKRNRLRS